MAGNAHHSVRLSGRRVQQSLDQAPAATCPGSPPPIKSGAGSVPSHALAGMLGAGMTPGGQSL
jgi:hypothetical protein